MDNKHSIIPRIPDEVLERATRNPRLLLAITKASFLYFFLTFFKRYMKHDLAPFHYDFINIAQDESVKRAVVIAFRSSAKSTILNTAHVIWAVMGAPQKKFVVIASQTQAQARQHLYNIRKEIEDNELLRKIFGPFGEGSDVWKSSQLVIPKFGAQIVAISVEEGKRGGRFGAHRPDLVLVDDIEDYGSTINKEQRDKTFDWLTGEIMTLGDENTKIVYLGNVVHDDGALVRIDKLVKEGEMPGVRHRIPLMDLRGIVAWPSRFPTKASIEDYKNTIRPESVWEREFMLRILPRDEQIIKPEDLHFYDSFPPDLQGDDAAGYGNSEDGTRYFALDLAASEKQTADFTALIEGKLFTVWGKPHIYILPNIFNKRILFPDLLDHLKKIVAKSPEDKRMPYGTYREFTFFVEDVGLQKILLQSLERLFGDWENCNSVKLVPMMPRKDKRVRFEAVAPFIKDGTVLFPRGQCEELLTQMFYFPAEEHDDILDALVYLILGIVEENSWYRPQIWSLDW